MVKVNDEDSPAEDPVRTQGSGRSVDGSGERSANPVEQDDEERVSIEIPRLTKSCA